MADLAVVALGLDATGMTSGAAQANRALSSVEKQMEKAEKNSTQFGRALSGLGGPMGQVSGQVGGLSSQLGDLTGAFGLAGGAAVAAVAGIAALSQALIKLTLDGVKLSDQMGDIAEVTQFSLDTVQRFGAGMQLAGEDIASIERPLRTFQTLVQQALVDKSGEAAKSLFALGTNAQIANRDIEGAFKKIVLNVKDLRTTTEGVVATNDLFGRSIGAIVRSSDQLANTLTGLRPALEDAFIIATEKGVQKGQELDTQINKLSNSWKVFTQNLAQGKTGEAISAGLDSGTGALYTFGKALQFVDGLISKSTYLQFLFGFGKVAINPFALVGQALQAPPVQGNVGAPGRAALFGVAPPPPAGGGSGGGGGRGGGRGRVDTPPNLPTSFDPIVSRGVQRAFDLINAMNDANEAAAKAARELPVVIDTMVEIFQRLGLPTFAGAAAPPITSGGIPGVSIGAPLPPSQIISARQGRIEDALGGIFEDFVFQITSARSTVGDAFKGLLLGITDTFAAEFAKAMQESLRDAFIKPLAGWLEDALTQMFSGISGKGLGKFFKAIGTSFVGLFAEGGTIPSNHWGIVGERGPEIAFAGSSPMQISPMGGGGGGHITMNFAITTATGEVSQRTQDQIADSAARGIERASRLRGAR